MSMTARMWGFGGVGERVGVEVHEVVADFADLIETASEGGSVQRPAQFFPAGRVGQDVDVVAEGQRVEQVLPLLGRARQDRLGEWLKRVYPEHPWLAKLVE
ncbi:hypothetical protein [Streptomyces sp. NPDC002619]|uniref:hypothetical protein n=1 Tax=Streptomyces sp. NPDC002619 TaxID=3364655 RepID=UPI0036AD40A8